MNIFEQHGWQPHAVGDPENQTRKMWGVSLCRDGRSVYGYLYWAQGKPYSLRILSYQLPTGMRGVVRTQQFDHPDVAECYTKWVAYLLTGELK